MWKLVQQGSCSLSLPLVHLVTDVGLEIPGESLVSHFRWTADMSFLLPSESTYMGFRRGRTVSILRVFDEQSSYSKNHEVCGQFLFAKPRVSTHVSHCQLSCVFKLNLD